MGLTAAWDLHVGGIAVLRRSESLTQKDVKWPAAGFVDTEIRCVCAAMCNGLAWAAARGRVLQQLIRIDVDSDGDVFGEWQFVERFADEPTQAHDGFTPDQNVKPKLAL